MDTEFVEFVEFYEFDQRDVPAQQVIIVDGVYMYEVIV